MNTSSDRIERKILLTAPRSRVWRALADAEELGAWFGVNLKGKRFAAGQRTQGQITHPGYEHVVWNVLIERVEPKRMLSWRWHPYGIDPKIDYTEETPTLVTFALADAEGGTLLTLTESGFDQVPAARRVEAFKMNSGGWDQQMKNIERHLSA
jgi:uncharacterized protein YndB with AHSA1/START domain